MSTRIGISGTVGDDTQVGVSVGGGGATIEASHGGFSGSVDLGGGSGSNGSSPLSSGAALFDCPGQPTEQAQYLLNVASADDIRALEAAANDDSTLQAIRTRNANRLAWHVSGGRDCKVVSVAGRAFTQLFYDLVAKYSNGAPVPIQQSPGEQLASTDRSGGIQVDVSGDVGGVPVSGGFSTGGNGTTGGVAVGDRAVLANAVPWIIAAAVALLLLLPVLRGK